MNSQDGREVRRQGSFTGFAAAVVLATQFGIFAGCKSDAPAAPNDGGGSGGAGGSGSGGSGSGTGGNTTGTGGAAGNGDGGPNPFDGAVDSSDGPAESGDGDAAAGGLKLPITRGDLQVLEFGSLVFKVNPALGARVTSFQIDGDELLTGPAEHPMYFGSTMWTSPAGDWARGTFNPPSVVDRDPYQSLVSAEGVITTTSGQSTTMFEAKTFTVSKVFRADIANQAIIIDYKITNRGTAPFSLSQWEVTRVFPGGLTFFPTGTGNKPDFLPQRMQLTEAMGYTWYDNTTHMATRGESKSGNETMGGFIAHVVPNAKGDLLFIKSFKDVAPMAAPPGHWEVELFCNNPHTYVELEDHNAYAPIAVGATSTQTVTWYLRRLPMGTDRRPGSTALIAAVKAVLKI